MKTVPIGSIILIFLSLILCFTRVISNSSARTFAKLNSFAGNYKPHFISFNSDGGEIDISWDVSVPFFKIPLNRIKENGEVLPLINVNTRGLSIAGMLTIIFTLAVPLLSKPAQGMHYRSDSQWSWMGNTMNEIILGNNYVITCIQRIVCTIVSEASHSDNPTSTDKIIDGLSSYTWFKEFINGTALQEAIQIGKGGHDCTHVYKECFITSGMLKNIMM
ncbi:uncharacterized protein LOC116852198 [Odontomachus brunneus]|uniref:uncharacterized protein LOC116852198 n=1 Tax=Odontomachus brunneus TaxID=486640 RepID=UPI0013F22087|nr:uncharacterized protein LOC116852198 [Odontomachus brunneus]XP_032688192.1 uncharacterized protein LOC116852198 [Odontomachus brunneus]XP_032688194.1 uncharacterized protein LOC116852198 [Odontomachus brunneus]XP_032688195.1 uncharacterized protein LOC116852198 [Odontomachus brunneus]